jgi:hypothetical protein
MKPLPVLRTTSYLTLHKMSVQRIRYFLKLSAFACKQFVCPGLFISNYAINQFTKKPSSTLPELPFSNYLFRSQDIAVDSVCNVLFVSTETRLLHIAGKSTEYFIRSSWVGKEDLLWKLRALVSLFISYLLTLVGLKTYRLPPGYGLLAAYLRNV